MGDTCDSSTLDRAGIAQLIARRDLLRAGLGEPHLLRTPAKDDCWKMGSLGSTARRLSEAHPSTLGKLLPLP
jgi:hypothetical protein